MSITVTIAGVDVTSLLVANTFVLTNAIGQRDTQSMVLASPDGSYVVPNGARITVTHSDLGPLFGGVVNSRKIDIQGAALYSTIDCASWEQIFDRRRCGQRVWSGNNAGDIFTRIFIDYMSDEALTATAVTAGPALSNFSVDYCSVREAFDALCVAASTTDQYVWDCPASGVTRFYPLDSFAAPFDVAADSGYVMWPISLSNSFDQFGNKVFVRLGRYIQDVQTQTFHPDGSTRSFSVDKPIAVKPTVVLDGVAQSVGIRDVDTGKQWYWQDGSPTIDQDPGETIPSSTSTLDVTFQGYQSTVLDCGQNEDSVSERQAAEGGTGWWMTVLESSNGTTYSDAQALASAWLEKHSVVPTVLEYRTWYGGVKAGQHQHVTLSIFGESINSDFVISSSVLVNEGDQWFWKIQAIDGAILGDWKAKLRDLTLGTVSAIGTAAPSGDGAGSSSVLMGSVSAVDAATLSPTDTNYHPRWKDPALHAVINVTPALAITQYPQAVTVWLTDGGGSVHWQGWWDLAADGQVISVGLQGSNSNVLAPTGADEHWTAIVEAGRSSGSPGPAAKTSASFVVAAPPAPLSNAATGCWIDQINYGSGGQVGMFGWGNLFGTFPLEDPNFFYARYTRQSGQIIGGVFTPGGDQATEQAIGDDSDCLHHPGSDQISLRNPFAWAMPAYKLSDGSLNPNNVWRLRCYVVSLLDPWGTKQGTATQQSAWSSGVGVSTPGTADHLDLVLDLSKGQVPGNNVYHPPLPNFSAITASASANYTAYGHDWQISFSGSFTPSSDASLQYVQSVRVVKISPATGGTSQRQQISQVYGPFTAGVAVTWMSTPMDLLSASAGNWTIELIPVGAYEDAGTPRDITVAVGAVTVPTLTAREVGPRITDTQRGLLTTIGFTPALNINPGGGGAVQHISVWFTYDRGDGKGTVDVPQGSFIVTGTGGSEIQVPGTWMTTLSSTSFKVSVVPRFDTSLAPPSDSKTYTFTLSGPGVAGSGLVSGASLSSLTYSQSGWKITSGALTAAYSTHPELLSVQLQVQAGTYSGGVWYPASWDTTPRNWLALQVSGPSAKVTGDSVSFWMNEPWGIPPSSAPAVRLSIQAATRQGGTALTWVDQTSAWSGSSTAEITYAGGYCYITPDPTKFPQIPGGQIQLDVNGPLYSDVSGNIKLRIASDFTVSGSPGNYSLSQNSVDLAKAVHFDTSQFAVVGGSMVIGALGVNKLVAGDALFAGDASFARSGGGKVTINSAGIAIGSDTGATPASSVTVTSTGASIVHGSNSVMASSTGVSIQGPSGILTATSSGVVISNGSNTLTASSTGITISNGSNSVSITSSSVTVSNGSNSVAVTSSSVTIGSSTGTLTASSSGVTIAGGSGSTLALAPGGATFTVGSTSTTINGDSISAGSVTAATIGATVGACGGVWLEATYSAYSVPPLRLGGYFLWVDGSGRLRIKGSSPGSDTDGTVVGSQS